MPQSEMTPRAAAWSGLVGGVMWAVTPLRDQVLGAGEDPQDGVGAFRAYNLYVLVAVLLMSALLLAHVRGRAGGPRSRPQTVAVAAMLTGHGLLAAGAAAAVLLGDRARDLVMAGQDLGFLGAMLAAVGALAFGTLGLRRGALSRGSAVLFSLALPAGVVGAGLLAAAGAPEDLLGLPLTALYGGAYVALGLSRLTTARASRSVGV